MNRFSYAAANDRAGALALHDQRSSTQFIAGGTNLLDLMKENVLRPNTLIDLNPIADLREISERADGGVRLGASAKNADTAYHPLIQKKYPLLAQAILAGASAQLRNMATNGGNLLQRTRCYYFYDTATPCNKREPGSGCPAKEGYNRIHAILGQSDQCIAVFPSDMCVGLAALDAIVNLSGQKGDRSVALADFHRLPGDTPERDNVLEAGELITSIDLPAREFSKNYAYLKLRDRESYAFALVSVAIALELEDGLIKDARLVLGGLAHKPWRRREAEVSLVGKPPTQESFSAAAEIVLAGAKGYQHNVFKIELARRAIVRNSLAAAALNS